MQKLLIICGPTATGKTDLGVLLAQKYNGEIISADSRQVYKGMDIGTGKDIPRAFRFQLSDVRHNDHEIGYYTDGLLRIWGLDIVNPNYRFNVGEYRRFAQAVIADIHKRGKLPIIVGGTGLYITSLFNPLEKIDVPVNQLLRKELESLSVLELQEKLQRLNLEKFASLNESDRQNPRRLVRAIEVASVIPVKKGIQESTFWIPDQVRDDKLFIGLTAAAEIINQRISDRVEARVKQGIIEEIQMLLLKGYSWDLTSFSATGYGEWKEYFEEMSNNKKEETIKKIIDLWKLHERQYAKRQMTWFRKMKQISWSDVSEQNWRENILAKVEKWYTKI